MCLFNFFAEYRVLYPYKAQQDGDLTLNEGDIIVVTESHDNGWWRGCLGEQEGWFPGTYVEVCIIVMRIAKYMHDLFD